MPAFYFRLRDGKSGTVADEGQELPGASAAKGYAVQVAREFMRGRELETRHCRLDVVDEHGDVVAEVPFATVDPTLDHLRPDLRSLMESLSNTTREVSEILARLDWLTLELRAPRACSHAKPYLITRYGRRL